MNTETVVLLVSGDQGEPTELATSALLEYLADIAHEGEYVEQGLDASKVKPRITSTLTPGPVDAWPC